MKSILLAGAFATALVIGLDTPQAQASCRDTNSCSTAAKAAKTHKTSRKTRAESDQKVHRSKAKAKARTKVKTKAVKASRRKSPVARTNRAPAPAGNHRQVVSLITSMAPSHGVPAWFALRIAHVESNYNPHARGSAGELGVFQLKCATARGIGYSGNCSGLLDARTNITYGLKHLSLAMKKSGGNLQLAASKHNGGLGRKTIIHGYVNKVF